MSATRSVVTGMAVPVRGDDIDTDRIVPARFARSTTFAGLGAVCLADERAAAAAAGEEHPLDDPRYAEARILFVGSNFGCGSSREHAVHAIAGWGRGIVAIVGVSFSDIFLRNCVSNGIVPVAVARDAMDRLFARIEAEPATEVVVDLVGCRVDVGGDSVDLTIDEGSRVDLIAGRWDALEALLDDDGAVALLASSPSFQFDRI